MAGRARPGRDTRNECAGSVVRGRTEGMSRAVERRQRSTQLDDETRRRQRMSDNNIPTVDIVSDVICPWCFVGKRRLERALKALPGGKTVQVRWLPYQLNPPAPAAWMHRPQDRSGQS